MSKIGRDDLISEVSFGRMSPAEAEAKASRVGLKPLASTPDPKKFEVMAEAWWTLPMSVAWIIWRAPNEVRENYDPYREECFDWHYREWRQGTKGSVFKGHFLEQRKRATLTRLALSARFDQVNDPSKAMLASFDGARTELWAALQDNRLQATGLPIGSEQRIPIPDYEWRDLQAIEERGRDVVRYSRLSTKGYDDVAFRRTSILALWPETRPEILLELPPTVGPEGPGYFPLYCAAHWIATHGGLRDFDPRETSIWASAFSDLLAHIASEEVLVTGVRSGVREKIDGIVFASLRVAYPFSNTPFDLILGDELYLSSLAYTNDDHWREGFNDCLESRAGTEWSQLMVRKSDVARSWPFTVGSGEASPVRTGAPGRPSSMHLVAAEHRRRLDKGEALPSLTAESEILEAWLGKAHPNLPQPTAKTIRNNIRAAHHAAKPRPK